MPAIRIALKGLSTKISWRWYRKYIRDSYLIKWPFFFIHKSTFKYQPNSYDMKRFTRGAASHIFLRAVHHISVHPFTSNSSPLVGGRLHRRRHWPVGSTFTIPTRLTTDNVYTWIYRSSGYPMAGIVQLPAEIRIQLDGIDKICKSASYMQFYT